MSSDTIFYLHIVVFHHSIQLYHHLPKTKYIRENQTTFCGNNLTYYLPDCTLLYILQHENAVNRTIWIIVIFFFFFFFNYKPNDTRYFSYINHCMISVQVNFKTLHANFCLGDDELIFHICIETWCILHTWGLQRERKCFYLWFTLLLSINQQWIDLNEFKCTPRYFTLNKFIAKLTRWKLYI